MAPKRNLSLKFLALRKTFSVLFQILGFRKGTKLFLPSSIRNIDHEVPPFRRPKMTTDAVHGVAEDDEEGSDEEEPLAGDSDDTRSYIAYTDTSTLSKMLQDKQEEKKKMTSYIPISGNIYRALTFSLYFKSDNKCTDVLSLGALTVFLIQLFAPMFLFTFQFVTIDWKSIGKPTKSDDFYLPETQTYAYVITTALAGVFFLAISMWAFNTLEAEVTDWARVYFTWHESRDARDGGHAWALYVGAVMNQYVLVMNVVITGMMFLTTDSPVDIVMNSLALQFLVTLDDFGGGFDFIPELWDAELVGQVFYEQAMSTVVWYKWGPQIAKKLGVPYTTEFDESAVSYETAINALFQCQDVTTRAEDKTMEYAFEKWPGEYQAYSITKWCSIFSRSLIVLTFVAYIVLTFYGIQKYPSASERDQDDLKTRLSATETMLQLQMQTIQQLQLQIQSMTSR